MEEEIKYGTTDLIPISQVVARTKVRLDLKDITDYDDEITLFINEAAMSLKAKPAFRKMNCKIPIDDCGNTQLPPGFKKLHGIRMCIQSPQTLTNNITYPFNSTGDMIYLEQTYFSEFQNTTNIQNGNNIQPILGVMEIIGNMIKFPLPCPFTHCIISYDGFVVDPCDGIMEMHPQYERGFSEYSRAMMLDTHNSLWTGNPNMLSKSIQDSMMTWVQQRKMLVSDAFADSFDNNKYMIKRVLHSLLNDQNVVSIY